MSVSVVTGDGDEASVGVSVVGDVDAGGFEGWGGAPDAGG